MTWSFSLGRLFGTDVRVHATFFLLLAWIGLAAYSDGGLPAAIENTGFVIALFGCVLAHEFGHALTARRFGIRTPDITLLPIGGMARLEKLPENPRQEIIVALAGPAVNIAIWAILVVLAGADTGLDQLAQIDGTGPGVVSRLAAINLILALFNLIPAFPMDGGRVFRALLALRMDRARATRIAAGAGQVVALLFGFAGLSGGNPVLVLIAVFVFVAANAENQEVAMRAVSRRLMARDAMITRYQALQPEDSIDIAANTLIHTTQHEFPVLNPDGTLLGFVTRTALFRALAGDGTRMMPVSEILATDIPHVTPTTGLETVLELMHKGAPAIAVSEPLGRLQGYITRENIGELMVVKGR